MWSKEDVIASSDDELVKIDLLDVIFNSYSSSKRSIRLTSDELKSD